MKLTRKQRLLLRKKRLSKARHKRRKMYKIKSNIELYRNDLPKFIEDFLGVELNSWKKALLKMNKLPYIMSLPRRNGYSYCNKTYLNMIDLYNKMVKE